LIICRDRNGEVEVHKVMIDISGATSDDLAQGDLLFIAAGIPHMVLVASKVTVTYVTVKIPTQPTAAP
jgi:hypothetical protein